VTGLPFLKYHSANRIPDHLLNSFKLESAKEPGYRRQPQTFPAKTTSGLSPITSLAISSSREWTRSWVQPHLVYVRYADNRPSLTPPTLNPNWSESTDTAGEVGLPEMCRIHSVPHCNGIPQPGFSMFSQNLITAPTAKNDIMNSILHINGYPTDPATWGVVVWG